MKIEDRDGQTIVIDGNKTFYLYLVAFYDREDNNTRLVFSQKPTPEELTIPTRAIYSRALAPDNMRIIKNHGSPIIIHDKQ